MSTVQGVRFRPPRVDVPPEVDWGILRAFAEPSLPASGPTLDQAKAVSAIVRLGLMPRIRSRTQPSLLEKEIGEEGLAKCEKVFWGVAAAAKRQEEVARDIADLASGMEIQLIFLKGMALQFEGFTAPGSRLAVDVDVLVPEHEADRLQQRLIERGAEATDFPEHQHLVPVRHPLGVIVEIHRNIPGMCLSDQTGATAQVLYERHLLEPLPEMGSEIYVPAPDVLLGHLLVHGLGQHGSAPESYPMSRLLADLQDMSWDSVRCDRFLDSGFEWIRREVNREEIEGLSNLLKSLARGELASSIVVRRDDAAVLLRHMLAGMSDTVYRQALKLERQLSGPLNGSGVSARLRNVLEALWLTNGQIDLVYGRPKSRLGYLGWRLWRPIDLLKRSLRSYKAARRLRKPR